MLVKDTLIKNTYISFEYIYVYGEMKLSSINNRLYHVPCKVITYNKKLVRYINVDKHNYMHIYCTYHLEQVR